MASLRQTTAILALATMAITACSDGSKGSATEPIIPPTGLTATATSSSKVTITFTGLAGDQSYTIQRAVGATSTDWTQLATVTPAAGSTQVSYTDTGLQPSTVYRYRVATVRSGSTSRFSGEVTVTTLAAGSFAATISGDITSNRTLSRDTTYTLSGFVHVTNGATLTIEPGTKILGDYNTLGSSLFIMRGAKINAQGTKELPIVFTSSRPAGQRQPGDWGGLIILGNGIINRTGSIEIEGTGTTTGSTPGTNYPVVYSGGTDNADNSGVLKYVRVEFAGFAPAPNQELNSFTFAAVGSGTKVSYVQALGGLDDGYEFFGGAVDVDHAVSYETGDDHFDMSTGYQGRLQYVIAFQSTVLTPRNGAGSPSSDPQGIENDGCESSAGAGCTIGYNSTPLTLPVVANFTLVGTGDVATSGSSGGVGMLLRRGVGGWYVNGIVARYPRAGVSLRDAETYARAGSVATPDLATADLALRSILFFSNPTVFQTGGSGTQNSLDLASNGLVNNATASVSSVFTAFPATVGTSTTAAAFDWTPASGSPALTGGMTTFSGKLATQTARPLASGNGSITGTSFVGAAPASGTEARWWAGWTTYARN
ncbi:MAG: fibronectin type III domain-containing protein [Gemmatimonadaceae bacterium]